MTISPINSLNKYIAQCNFIQLNREIRLLRAREILVSHANVIHCTDNNLLIMGTN